MNNRRRLDAIPDTDDACNDYEAEIVALLSRWRDAIMFLVPLVAVKAQAVVGPLFVQRLGQHLIVVSVLRRKDETHMNSAEKMNCHQSLLVDSFGPSLVHLSMPSFQKLSLAMDDNEDMIKEAMMMPPRL